MFDPKYETFLILDAVVLQEPNAGKKHETFRTFGMSHCISGLNGSYARAFLYLTPLGFVHEI